MHASFLPGVNYIVGRNGQGKTNVLEAIYLLGTTRSFRTAQKQDLIAFGADESSIFGHISQKISDLKLGIIYKNKQRILEVNDSKVSSASEFAGRLLCVSFFPGDIQIVKGGPAERRRFIDKHIVDLKPALLSTYMEYSHALRNKNALLKRGEADNNRMLAWNTIIARSAFKIVTARDEFLRAITPILNKVHKEITGEAGALNLQLDSDCRYENDTTKSETELLEVFMQELPKERVVKRTLKGPHRDDVDIKLATHPARAFASQGQSRSIVLSLKIAAVMLMEERCGDTPVVLLDDVDSELDSYRRRGLFEFLLEGDRQIILTGTDVAEGLVERKTAINFLQIENGVISAGSSL